MLVCLQELSQQPLQTLYGHESEVMCVAISTELDMAVSGGRDGTCLVHTVRSGRHTHTLLPRRDSMGACCCEVQQVAISNYGRVLLYTQEPTHRTAAVSESPFRG